MNEIIEQIKEERLHQDGKFGVQNYPVLDQVLINRPSGCTPERMCTEYEIPIEIRAKSLCDTNAEQGSLNWMHILVEEVSEAASCLNDVENLRKELIQVAAVAIAMIESLDRNGK